MTTVVFCDNLPGMARGIRVLAEDLQPGDYLMHTRREIVAVDEGDESRLVVTTRAGQVTFTHRWLRSTPVIIAPR